MTIALTGLGSFDSSGVVNQLTAIAQQPINALTTKKNNLDSAVSTMNLFESRLSTLSANAASMSDPVGYASFVTSSSDASIATSTSGAALPGSYDVSVTKLASIEKLRGTAQASSSTALGMSGTMSVSVGTGKAVDISIAATDTLGDIATKLSTSGARLSASVLYDGSKYRLSVQGLDTGAANSINVTQSGFDLGLANPANVYQPASDASLTIDGLPITRPTNQITGVIPGVTLAITKPGATSTVTVASDTTALKNKLNAFVASYNDVINAGHSAAGYGLTKASNTALQSDTSIRGALTTFSNLAGHAVPGTSGAYTTLGSVGIKLGNDGTLSFDSTSFDKAVTNDPDGVRKLFVTDTASGAQGVMKSFTTAVTSLVTGTTGAIAARIAAFTATSSKIVDTMATKQTQVDAYTAQLKKQFTNLDIQMSKYSAQSSALNSLNPTTTTTTAG